MEYQYDDQIPVDKNIAISLFAIANELKKSVDNNSDQFNCLYKLQEKAFGEILNRIRMLNDAISAFSLIRDKSGDEKEIDVDIIAYYLCSISENLDLIRKILKHEFILEDDDDWLDE
jgi:hypothetical protein